MTRYRPFTNDRFHWNRRSSTNPQQTAKPLPRHLRSGGKLTFLVSPRLELTAIWHRDSVLYEYLGPKKPQSEFMRLATSHTARSMPSITRTETSMLTALFIVAFLPLAILIGMAILASFISAIFK